MNKQRRKNIEKLVKSIQEFQQVIEELKIEEQDYLDNMPENFQNGEKGENAQSAIDSMDEAISNIDEVIYSLESAME